MKSYIQIKQDLALNRPQRLICYLENNQATTTLLVIVIVKWLKQSTNIQLTSNIGPSIVYSILLWTDFMEIRGNGWLIISERFAGLLSFFFEPDLTKSFRVFSFQSTLRLLPLLSPAPADKEVEKSPYLPKPSARAGHDTRSIYMRSLTGFNSEFSFS